MRSIVFGSLCVGALAAAGTTVVLELPDPKPSICGSGPDPQGGRQWLASLFGKVEQGNFEFPT